MLNYFIICACREKDENLEEHNGKIKITKNKNKKNYYSHTFVLQNSKIIKIKLCVLLN